MKRIVINIILIILLILSLGTLTYTYIKDKNMDKEILDLNTKINKSTEDIELYKKEENDLETEYEEKKKAHEYELNELEIWENLEKELTTYLQ